MVIAYYVPVWQILMWAPQYPEGLEMKIWLNTLTGDYKIISGLNHYIGMKHIEIEMFPEFEVMPYLLGGLIGFGVLAALAGRKLGLISYVVLLIVAAVAGLTDFWLWGYDYGHNLDPTAPIIVPGMAYQPPLLGTKQLLNFTAYSGPDIGGYIILVSGLLAIGVFVYEIRVSRKKLAPVMAAITTMLFISSCSTSPEPIVYGSDGCHACKMTIVDKHFGAEVVTKKGKVYKFDDVRCVVGFVRSGEVEDTNVAHLLVVDYANPTELIDAASAVLVRSPQIKSPMNGQVAAFSDARVAEEHLGRWDGSQLTWKNLVADGIQ